MRGDLVSKLTASLPTLQQNLTFADIAALLIQNDVILDVEYQSIVSTNTESLQLTMLINFLSGKEDAMFDKFVEVLGEVNECIADDVKNGICRGDVTDSAAVAPRQRLCTYRDDNKENPGVSNEESSRKRKSNTPPRRRPSKISSTSVQSSVTSVPCSKSPVIKIESQNPVNDTADDSTKLNEVVTDEVMTVLKKNHRACRDWTSLAHSLGLSRLVNKIRVKVLVFGEDLDVCVVHLLQEWVGEKPKDATLGNLLHALRNEGFNDVADELVEKFAV